MVSEQVEVLSEQIDVDELVDAHDLDHSQQGVPFFLSLIRELPGTFLPEREQSLAEQMRKAVADVLRNVDRQ